MGYRSLLDGCLPVMYIPDKMGRESFTGLGKRVLGQCCEQKALRIAPCSCKLSAYLGKRIAEISAVAYCLSTPCLVEIPCSKLVSSKTRFGLNSL